MIENTVTKMVALGAVQGDISAVIGPTISQESYEVGEAFYHDFMVKNPDYQQFFVPATKEQHFMFNLPGLVEYRLQALGLKSVDNINRNTYGEPDLFYSYRRTCHQQQKDFGRLLSVVAI